MQIVAPKKPRERAVGFHQPSVVAADMVGIERRQHHGVRLQRLLVEACWYAAALIETVAADRNKVTFFATLKRCQPSQRLQPGVTHIGPPKRLAAQQQRLRQDGVIIRELTIKPTPVVGAVVVVACEQALGQRPAHLLRQAVAAKTLEVGMDAKQGKCPGTRVVERQDCWQRALKQHASDTSE
jgi:hypothetical protein